MSRVRENRMHGSRWRGLETGRPDHGHWGGTADRETGGMKPQALPSASHRASPRPYSRTSAGRPGTGASGLRRVTISKADAGEAARSRRSSGDARISPSPSRGDGCPVWCEGTARTTPCPATRGGGGLPQPGDPALVQGAAAPQPAHPPQLGARWTASPPGGCRRPAIAHPCPGVRFDARTQGRSPVR